MECIGVWVMLVSRLSRNILKDNIGINFLILVRRRCHHALAGGVSQFLISFILFKRELKIIEKSINMD